MPILDGLGRCSTGYLTGGLGSCNLVKFIKKIAGNTVSLITRQHQTTRLKTKKAENTSLVTRKDALSSIQTKSKNEGGVITIVRGDGKV